MKEQLAIEMLKNLQRSAEGENVKGFSFHRGFDIHWHLYANTAPVELGGLHHDFLDPVLAEMGLDSIYPVEAQVFDNKADMFQTHTYSNLYDASTECGKIRLALIKKLVEYFQNVVDNNL